MSLSFKTAYQAQLITTLNLLWGTWRTHTFVRGTLNRKVYGQRRPHAKKITCSQPISKTGFLSIEASEKNPERLDLYRYPWCWTGGSSGSNTAFVRMMLEGLQAVKTAVYCTVILKSQGMEWNFNILMSHSNANAGKMNKFFSKLVCDWKRFFINTCMYMYQVTHFLDSTKFVNLCKWGFKQVINYGTSCTPLSC